MKKGQSLRNDQEYIRNQKIKEHTEPVDVRFGVLTVKTSSPVWRQELQFQKKSIMNSINKKLKKTTIKDIRFI